MKRKRPAGFCNVDLDIVSHQRLDLVVEELGKSLLVLHHGKGLGRTHLLMVEGLKWPNTPDSAANELCRAIERLSPKARKVWDRARRKEFNVGYELESGVQRVEVALEPKLVRRIVALGGTVAFTCYRGEKTK
jgi:hypothetical protein